jgi:hypothetical protein
VFVEEKYVTIVGEGHQTNWDVTVGGGNDIGVRGGIDPFKEGVEEQSPFDGGKWTALAKAARDEDGTSFTMTCNDGAKAAYVQFH